MLEETQQGNDFMPFELSGLVAATLTPMQADGTLNLEPIPRVVESSITCSGAE